MNYIKVISKKVPKCLHEENFRFSIRLTSAAHNHGY